MDGRYRYAIQKLTAVLRKERGFSGAERLSMFARELAAVIQASTMAKLPENHIVRMQRLREKLTAGGLGPEAQRRIGSIVPAIAAMSHDDVAAALTEADELVASLQAASEGEIQT